MRDTPPRRWQHWRALFVEAGPIPVAGRFDRLPLSGPLGPVSLEQPGPDGIRHGLVARIREQIAAGTFDTEERWLAAEEELLRRVAGRR
jgi:hypothetical protein